MPTLAPTNSSLPPTASGCRIASSTFCATTRAASADSRSGSTTANSSPPSRATVSPARRQCCMRVPIARSSSSPEPWPSVSFTRLKRSRSTKSSPTCQSLRRACMSACSRRSRKSARFGSPVSGSDCASQAILSSASLRRRNWPSWLPVTCTARIRRSSGSRTRRLKVAITPITLPSDCTGKAKALRRPRRAFCTRRETRSSARVSGTQIGVPDSQIRPASPSPRAKVISRDSSRRPRYSSGSAAQPSRKRSTPADSSTPK